MAPATRYAKSGDIHLAYQVSGGTRPPNVVMVPGFVSNVEMMWDLPYTGAALRRAGEFARVISFDKRGTGLSDRSVGIATLEDRMGDVGLRIRAGLHTGECVARGDDLAGIAVHIAARVVGAAAPGEVLVSRTVTDLVAGSGLAFVDRGEHELKGVSGSWQLYAVA